MFGGVGGIGRVSRGLCHYLEEVSVKTASTARTRRAVV